MVEKLITVAVLIIMVCFVLFVLRQPIKQVLRERKQEGKAKKKIAIPFKKPELSKGVLVEVKYAGERNYVGVEAKKQVFTIGDHTCDLDLKVPYVKGKQAAIRKIVAGNEPVFAFVNYGKREITGTEYYNPETDRFEWMEEKDTVILARDIFYIGEVKLRLVAPKLNHTPSKTENDIKNDGNVSNQEGDSYNKQRIPSGRIVEKVLI